MLLFVLSGCLSDLTRIASDPWRGLDPRHPPAGYEVYGIDVSHHQGRIDWAQVGESRQVDFVYVKATEGRHHRDRRFVENWSGARDAGLWVGAYHYFSACRTGAEQAEHFLATVPLEVDALPPVVDIEPDRNCNTPARMTEVGPELAVWIDRVAEETGLQPVVYSSARLHEGFQQTVDDEAVRDAPRWVASWNRGPTLPWTIWQYTDRSSVPGISGPVDGDVFRGSLHDLMELASP